MNIVIKKEMVDDLLLTNDEHTIRRNISDYVLVQHQLLSTQPQVSVEPVVRRQKTEGGETMEALRELLVANISKQLLSDKPNIQYLDVLNRLLGTVNNCLVSNK